MNIPQNKLVWVIAGMAVVIVVLLSVIIGVIIAKNSVNPEALFNQENLQYDKRALIAFEHLQTVRDNSDRIIEMSKDELDEYNAEQVRKMVQEMTPGNKEVCSYHAELDEHDCVITTVTVNTEALKEIEREAAAKAQRVLLEKGLFLIKFHKKYLGDDSDLTKVGFQDIWFDKMQGVLNKLEILGEVSDENKKMLEELIDYFDSKVDQS